MTDPDAPRPAPRYGEYATPEQQREIMRQSEPAGTPPSAAPGALPGAVPGASAVSSTPAPVPSALNSAAGPAQTGPLTRRRGDRFVTIALLAYGLFTVVTTVPQLVDYASFAETWAGMAGVDAQLIHTDSGRMWGAAAAVVFVAGWAITAWLSWRTIRRGRISWWIPLVGAVATIVVVSIFLSVPLFSDPAIVDQLGRLSPLN